MSKNLILFAIAGIVIASLFACTPAVIEPVAPTVAKQPTEPAEPPQPTLAATGEPAESTAVENLTAGATQVNPVDGMVQVYVPAGSFIMGTDDTDSYGNEGPQHEVFLSAFWIDKYLVTTGQYARCQEFGSCKEPLFRKSSMQTSYYGNPKFQDFPVIYVNWYDALAYCTWAGRRLPTEAEWEKAARGTDGRKYTWGIKALDKNKCNYNLDVGDPSKVGSYPEGASPYGAMDMAGNVWEWVSDWFGKDYYKQSPKENPQGPESGTYRGLRGGAWNDVPGYMRVTARLGDTYGDPNTSSYNLGFRCAR